jgi:hypothetical protein
VLKRTLLAYAAPISIVSLMTATAQAQSIGPANNQRPNPIVNPDGSVTIAIAPFNTEASVVQRPRPEYDPLGIHLSDFLLLPSVSAGMAYNSNVYNTENNAKSDVAFELMPTLRLLSDFPRHALSLLIGAHSLFYNRLSSENTTDVTVSGQGRLDIRRETNVALEAGYQVLHEGRGAPDLPGNAAEPTEYSATNAKATLNQAFNRVQLSVGASIQRLDFRDTKLVPPGPAVLDNHDRDRNEATVFGQAGYELSPGYSAFLRGSYDVRNYDLTVDAAGFRRDSHGSETDAGMQFEVSRLMVGQVYAGYLKQSFDDVRFSNVSGAAFGAQLEWYPTLMTTVRFNARRSVEETTLLDASSYTATRFAVGLDHELLRNFILSADLLYDVDEYNGSPRTDKFWGLSFGAMYLLNRNLQANFGYVFSRRDSNLTGFDYTNNLFRIGIVGKL